MEYVLIRPNSELPSSLRANGQLPQAELKFLLALITNKTKLSLLEDGRELQARGVEGADLPSHDARSKGGKRIYSHATRVWHGVRLDHYSLKVANCTNYELSAIPQFSLLYVVFKYSKSAELTGSSDSRSLCQLLQLCLDDCRKVRAHVSEIATARTAHERKVERYQSLSDVAPKFLDRFLCGTATDPRKVGRSARDWLPAPSRHYALQAEIRQYRR